MNHNVVVLDASIFETPPYISSVLNAFDKSKKTILLIESCTHMHDQLLQITKQYVDQDQAQALLSFQTFIESTLTTCRALFPDDNSIFNDINDLFVEIEWILEDEIMDGYTYYYDQITSIGTLIQSKIVTEILQMNNIIAQWVDTRDLIITDENYQNPNILIELSKTNLEQLSLDHHILVLPNKIGASLNITTTTFQSDSVYQFFLEVFEK